MVEIETKIKKILIIVDVQNCFISQGTLGHGEEIHDINLSIKQIENIEKLIENNERIILSRDNHPLGHTSFNAYGVHCRNNNRTCTTINTTNSTSELADDILLRNKNAERILQNNPIMQSPDTKQITINQSLNKNRELFNKEFIKRKNNLYESLTTTDLICKWMNFLNKKLNYEDYNEFLKSKKITFSNGLLTYNGIDTYYGVYHHLFLNKNSDIKLNLENILNTKTIFYYNKNYDNYQQDLNNLKNDILNNNLSSEQLYNNDNYKEVIKLNIYLTYLTYEEYKVLYNYKILTEVEYRKKLESLGFTEVTYLTYDIYIELLNKTKLKISEFKTLLDEIISFILEYKKYEDFMNKISPIYINTTVINGYKLSYLFLGTSYSSVFNVLNTDPDTGHKHSIGLLNDDSQLSDIKKYLLKPDLNFIKHNPLQINGIFIKSKPNQLFVQLNKGEFCDYDSYSAFNYHTKFENNTMTNIFHTNILKQYSTGLWEYITQLMNITNSKGVKPKLKLNITVCGLVGDICVIHTIIQGIFFWKTYFASTHTNIEINFIYDISGTLFSKFNEFNPSYEIIDFTYDNIIKFYNFFNKIVITLGSDHDISFDVKYQNKHLFKYTKSIPANIAATEAANAMASQSTIGTAAYKYNKYKQKYLNANYM